MEENKEIMLVEDVRSNIISSINETESALYTSFNGDDVEAKKIIFNAMSCEGTPVKSMNNKVIKVVDVIIIPADIENDDGTKSIVPRSILIDDKGEYYTATSWGVFRSLQRIKSLFGDLHFDEGLPIVPHEVKTKKGFTITFEIQ